MVLRSRVWWLLLRFCPQVCCWVAVVPVVPVPPLFCACLLVEEGGGEGVEVEDAGVHDGAALEGCAEGAVDAVFEVEVAAVADDVGEEVAVEGGVFGEEGFEVEVFLGGDEPVEAYLGGGYAAPVALGESVVGVGSFPAYAFENHAPYSTVIFWA